MRYLGIDHGEKNMGLALGDWSPEAGLKSPAVTPLLTFKVTSTPQAIHELVFLCVNHQIDQVVMGLPLNKEGKVGLQGKKVQEFAKKLERKLGKKIDYWDESYSSYIAIHKMILENTTKKARKEKSDQYAAAAILQEYLNNKAQIVL